MITYLSKIISDRNLYKKQLFRIYDILEERSEAIDGLQNQINQLSAAIDGLQYQIDQLTAAVTDPDIKPKRFYTEATGYGTFRVRDSKDKQVPAVSLPTREAAERIAAIYEEVMP